MSEGHEEIEVEPELINKFYSDKFLSDDRLRLRANEYVILRDSSNPNHSAIGRFSEKDRDVIPLISHHESIGASIRETSSKPSRWIAF